VRYAQERGWPSHDGGPHAGKNLESKGKGELGQLEIQPEKIFGFLNPLYCSWFDSYSKIDLKSNDF
jgi:hypothetical protein